LSGVSRVATGDGGQSNPVDGSRESNRWGLDQGNVVVQGDRVEVGVLLEVGAGNGVGQFGAGANGGTIVNGHGIGPV